jgi:hypothetical protein
MLGGAAASAIADGVLGRRHGNGISADGVLHVERITEPECAVLHVGHFGRGDAEGGGVSGEFGGEIIEKIGFFIVAERKVRGFGHRGLVGLNAGRKAEKGV